MNATLGATIAVGSPWRGWRFVRATGLVVVAVGMLVMLLPTFIMAIIGEELFAIALDLVIVGGSLAASGFGLFGAASGMARDAARGIRRPTVLDRVAIAAAGGSIVAALAASVGWLATGDIEGTATPNFALVRVAAALAVVAAAVEASAVLVRLPLATLGQRLLRIVAMVLLILMGAILLAMCGVPWFLDGNERMEAYGWLVVVVLCVGIPGMFTTFGLFSTMRAAAARRGRRGESVAESIRLELDCPRCSHAMTVPMGASTCPSCRFTIMVEVEEPRCECGYPLFTLRSGNCPECGRAVDVGLDG